jgi:hypothetical protein
MGSFLAAAAGCKRQSGKKLCGDASPVRQFAFLGEPVPRMGKSVTAGCELNWNWRS